MYPKSTPVKFSALLWIVVLFAALFSGGAVAQDNTRQIVVESVGPGAVGKRVALVIGNNSYANLPASNQLVTAVNDARSVKAALAAMGFDVVYGENVTRVDFLDRFSDFQSRIDKNTLALFYYAGHGVQLQNGGGNYLLPSDVMPPETTRPFEEDRLAQSSISDTYVVEGIKKAGADVAVVILDACRNNPLEAKSTRSVLGGSKGLSRVDYPKGVFSIYSAGYNETALDRLPGEGDGVNSVFTRSFLKYLPQPGLSLQDLAREVGDEVDALTAATGHSQSPAYIDQVRGRTVYLAAPPEAAGGAAPEGDAAAARKKAAEMEFELAYWNSVKDSKDPGSFDLYLRQYPSGQFAALARQKLQQITADQRAQADRLQEDERLWAQALADGGKDALDRYIAAFPDGRHVAEAKSRLASLLASSALLDADSILWDAVKGSDDPSRIGIYIEKFPAGRHAAEARAQLKQIELNEKAENAEEELKAWEAIQYASNPQAYADFAARYPQSTFAQIARQKAQVLREQSATDQQPPATSSSPPPDNSYTVREIAVQVPDYIQRIWSQDNARAMSELMPLYASSVEYFGKTVSYDKVFADKQSFAQRWDVRNYRVQPGSINVRCSGDICDISFMVDWDARSTSRKKTSRGLAESTYRVRVSGNSIEILAESGRVINRY
jgi:hypothetical protein